MPVGLYLFLFLSPLISNRGSSFPTHLASFVSLAFLSLALASIRSFLLHVCINSFLLLGLRGFFDFCCHSLGSDRSLVLRDGGDGDVDCRNAVVCAALRRAPCLVMVRNIWRLAANDGRVH